MVSWIRYRIALRKWRRRQPVTICKYEDPSECFANFFIEWKQWQNTKPMRKGVDRTQHPKQQLNKSKGE